MTQPPVGSTRWFVGFVSALDVVGAAAWATASALPACSESARTRAAIRALVALGYVGALLLIAAILPGTRPGGALQTTDRIAPLARCRLRRGIAAEPRPTAPASGVHATVSSAWPAEPTVGRLYEFRARTRMVIGSGCVRGRLGAELDGLDQLLHVPLGSDNR
jgi:hypothetical protein